MPVTGITDQMLQYEKGTETIIRNKPKHPKAHGVKRPESINIVAMLAVLFLIFA